MTRTTDWTTDRTSTTYKRVSRYILDNQHEYFTPSKMHHSLRLRDYTLTLKYMTEHPRLTQWGRKLTDTLDRDTSHDTLTSLSRELERGFNPLKESGYQPKRHTGILTADIKSPLDTPSAVDERYISGYDSNGYVKPEAHYNKELGAWVVPSP